ncbi:MAG: virulence protein E, partial [Firmicutes bacterium]|nr:virulence protein E [Bacillota bacterium]
EEPTTKQGIVGTFCRCYSISEAISKFLPDLYSPVDDSLTRYTFAGASGYGGLVVYDKDTFAYSHHESDPCGGREVNAFDLVRIHKFGKLDDRVNEKTNLNKLPSQIAMEKYAVSQPEVRRMRMSEIQEEFSDEALDDDLEGDSWKEQLEFHHKTGDLLPTANNIELILSHGEWHGVLAYDAFRNTEVIKNDLPWRKKERPHRLYEPWLGEDDDRRDHWFNKNYGFSSGVTIKKAFTEVTRRNKFHPIKSYVESRVWDGIERAEAIFIDYLGAPDTHYIRQVTRKMLLAAIKRLYEPGCKFDYMLVLIGPQGAGKSSILAKLGGEWSSDSLKNFENKEAGEHLQSGWIFEIGELSAMKRSEIEEVKLFLSKTEDRYRVAYDRVVSDFPRKCVFFGTTNNREFLRDPTGNRRFWPVELNPKKAKYSHWKHLTDELVIQIWAEVLCWFKAGETLELDEQAAIEANHQQAQHMESDPREGIIQEWLETPVQDEWGEEQDETMRIRVCAAQVWTECLGNKKGSMRPWEAKEICDILRRIPGWQERKGKAKMPGGYGVQRVFERIKKGLS